MSNERHELNESHEPHESNGSHGFRRERRAGAGRSEGDFTCMHCGWTVPARAVGTRHRNHCPRCLWSRHLDEEPGDRRMSCREPMEPVAIEVRGDGEWAIVHRCRGCGHLRTNRIAGDDHERSLLALALRPIARPAFPIDDLRGPG